jgi:hypothetical protein
VPQGFSTTVTTLGITAARLAPLVPAVAGAVDNLQKVGISPEDVAAIIKSPTSQKLVDNLNGTNINVIQDVGGKLVGITLDPTGSESYQPDWCEQTRSRTASQVDGSLRSRRKQMELSSDVEMKKIAELAQQFYEHILDDKPFFVSDEASILDVSGAEPEELLARIAEYYGKTVSMADLQQPLWKLIRQLSEGRSADQLR